MRHALILLTILLSLEVRARESFKAFRSSKIQLSKSISVFPTSTELAMMVDQACLDGEALRDKHGSDSLQKSGFIAQHKSLSSMRYRAVAVKVDRDQSLDQLKASVESNDCIVGVSENAIVRTQADPMQAQQIYLPVIAAAQGEKFFFHPVFGIRRPVTVAVVDSGVQMDHPDLATRLWTGPLGERGYDFANGDADPSDDFGHGTHVSGIIVAQKDNGVGIRGIMGDWSKLMPVKTQGSLGQGNIADVVNGIRWAADHGAEVINLSLASRSENVMLKDAIEYAIDKGITVVAAAGNDGEEVKPANFISPVGYAGDLSGLIGVGATDVTTKNRASYSNYGPNYVEISAPASKTIDGILSTFINSGYRQQAGTSMAAPQVTGAAALICGFMKTRGLAATPVQIENLIEASALENSNNTDFFSNGRALNIERLGRLIFNSTVIDSTGGFDE